MSTGSPGNSLLPEGDEEALDAAQVNPPSPLKRQNSSLLKRSSLTRTKSQSRIGLGLTRSRSKISLLLPESKTTATLNRVPLQRGLSTSSLLGSSKTLLDIGDDPTFRRCSFSTIPSERNIQGLHSDSISDPQNVQVSWIGTKEEYAKVVNELERVVFEVLTNNPDVWLHGMLCAGSSNAIIGVLPYVFPLKGISVQVENRSVEYYQKMLLGPFFHWREIKQDKMTNRWEARIRRLANVQALNNIKLGSRHDSSRALHSKDLDGNLSARSGVDTARSHGSTGSRLHSGRRESASSRPGSGRRESVSSRPGSKQKHSASSRSPDRSSGTRRGSVSPKPETSTEDHSSAKHGEAKQNSGKSPSSGRRRLRSSSGSGKRGKMNPFKMVMPWSERQRLWQCPEGWSVQVKYIGSYASRIKALRATERGIGKRNKGVADNKGQLSSISIADELPDPFKCFYFHVTVECPQFAHLDVTQRVAVVRSALISAVGQIPLLSRRAPPIPSNTNASKFGLIGNHVQHLEMFKHCPFLFTTTCTVSKTGTRRSSSVSKSSRGSRRQSIKSEESGSTYMSQYTAQSNISRQNIPEAEKVKKTLRAAKRKAQKSIQQVTAFSAKNLVQLVNNQHMNGEDDDEPGSSRTEGRSLSLCSKESTQAKPRRSRRRSTVTTSFVKHFANLKLADGPQTTAVLPSVDTGKRESMASHHSRKPRARNSAVFNVAVQKPASPESSFVQTHIRFTRAAVVLQRQFRFRLTARATRLQVQRLRRTLDLQRWVRGSVSRHGYALFRRKATKAATTIQSFFRMVIGRSHALQHRVVRSNLARRVQPIVRGFLARRFVVWLRRAMRAAHTAQRLVRGFLTRTEFKRAVARAFHHGTVLPAVLCIQCTWRSFVARRLCDELRTQFRIKYVEEPACVLIQSYWRRTLARTRVRVLIAQRRAATVLQKNIRMHFARQQLRALKHEALRNRSATAISALVRGFLSRRLVWLLQQRYNWLYKVLPTICRLQAKFRQRQTVKAVELRKKQVIAAPKIQKMYRRVKAQERARNQFAQLAVTYRHRQATRVQCAYRCCKARERVRFIKQQKRGAVLHAARVVQGTWRRYRAFWDEEWTREDCVIIKQHEHLDFHAQRRSNMGNDIDAVKREKGRLDSYLKKAWRHVRELKATRVEWERRIPVVEKEMEELTEQDVERGWAEAYELEWDILTNSMGMLEEDLLSKRLQIRQVEETRDDLTLEIDDVEVDMDEEILASVRVYEAQHRMQIHLSHKALAFARRKAVYYQASKWKIRDRRSSKLARLRKSQHDDGLRETAFEQDKSMKDTPESRKMSFKEAQSVQFKVMERYKRRIEKMQMVDRIKQRLAEMAEVRRTGKDNVVLRKLANENHQAILELLRRHTFDMRHEKNDGRSDPNKFCQQCGMLRHGMCICPEDDGEKTTSSDRESDVDEEEKLDKFL